MKECTSDLMLIMCAGLYKLDVAMWLWIYVVCKALPMFFVAGGLGGIPSTRDIVASGVQQLERETIGQKNPLGNTVRGGDEVNDKMVAQHQGLLAVGAGFTALAKKLVEKIQANECIEQGATSDIRRTGCSNSVSRPCTV